jgi:putative oxidoreductase
MKGMLSNRWMCLSLRIIIGGVFLYAGILKTQTPQSFADSIASYQLLPNALINLVALSLPIFEMAVGAMLITGFRLRVASLSALILSGIFAAALISALARGLNIDCGCFGNGTPSLQKTWLSLGRDLLLGLIAIVIRSQN